MDPGGPNDLSDFIARVNRTRHEYPALRSDHRPAFHATDDNDIVRCSKYDTTTGNRIVTVANLDPNRRQSGRIDLDLAAHGIEPDRPYRMQDPLAGGHDVRHGRNFVLLDPQVVPAHVFRVRQHVRTEYDFDYFE